MQAHAGLEAEGMQPVAAVQGQDIVLAGMQVYLCTDHLVPCPDDVDLTRGVGKRAVDDPVPAQLGQRVGKTDLEFHSFLLYLPQPIFRT